jgi:hypothetical protein
MGNFGRAMRAVLGADALIAAIWANVALKRAGLGALAVFAAAFALALLDAAGVVGLLPPLGLFWALIAVAGANLALALILVFAASRIRHARELALAQELRRNALEQLSSARQSPLASLFGLVGGPREHAGLISLATMLIGLLRAAKPHTPPPKNGTD